MINIFINPGHSPQSDIDSGKDWDVGACGHGLQENIVSAQVCNLLVPELQSLGFGIAGNFQSMSLWDITDTANSTNADIFVSVHCNSAISNAKGTETFYCLGSSIGKQIAQDVQSSIVSSLGTIDRGVKDDTQTHHHMLHVLRHTSMPAILIELAFISNPDDALLLKNYQWRFAHSIAGGLAKFCGFLPRPDIVDSPSDKICPTCLRPF